jgi:hypothetical protein
MDKILPGDEKASEAPDPATKAAAGGSGGAA